MDQSSDRLTEPKWLPKWITETPFRHPIFLVVLLIPVVAFALHGALSITHDPFRNAFDDLLHGLFLWSFLISPMLFYCGWRKSLFLLNRRLRLSERCAWALTYLLVSFLLLQLYWFWAGTQHEAERGFSPMLPQFLAGPLIGITLGLLHVQQATKRSFLGFTTLVCSMAWLLFPVAATSSLLTDGKGDGNNWFDAVPLAGSCADGLMLLLSMPYQSRIQDTPWTFLAFFVGILLTEAWIRKLPFRSTMLSFACFLAVLPFFDEWQHFWWD